MAEKAETSGTDRCDWRAIGERARHDLEKHFRKEMARVTGLEPATSGVTGRHSNRLSYTRA